MSSPKEVYRYYWRWCRKYWRPGSVPDAGIAAAFGSNQRAFLMALVSFDLRRNVQPGYHWQNPRRGIIFRSGLYLRRYDIPF